MCHAEWINLHGICIALNKLLNRFRNCIWRFESSPLSQPVQSLGDVSCLQEFARFCRELARPSAVSAAQFLECSATTTKFHAPVSSTFFNIRFLAAETRFDVCGKSLSRSLTGEERTLGQSVQNDENDPSRTLSGQICCAAQHCPSVPMVG